MRKTARRLLAALVLCLAVAGTLGSAHADALCLQTRLDQLKPTICVPLP